MSGERPSARPGRWRRRGRVLLAAGALVFLAGAGGIFLLREKPRAYTPGTEAATGEEITNRLARGVPAAAPRIEFRDVAAEAGIAFRHFSGKRSTQLPEDMGSGLAWGDYDDDGDPDLFLVNEAGPLTLPADQAQASPARSRLFRNDGNGRFSDVTDSAGLKVAGWGMGAAWGDFDSDGRLDLVVTRFGTNLLLRNRGDGTFEDVSHSSAVDRAEGFWSGAAWGDYDRDGDPDLYICGYVRYRHDPALAGKSSSQYNAVVPYTLNPSTYPPEINLLLRNDRGVFHEVAAAAGVDNPTGRSLSATWADFDLDGWPDLYVANDVSDNAMFRNLGNGRFQDVSHSAWVADHRGAMGLAVGDWDGDADFDIFITHWLAQENALYDNQSGVIAASEREPLHFVDEADLFGLGQIALDFVGWGTELFDYDNDGRLDILAVNGSTFQREDDPALLIPMKNQLFWNAGRPKGFFEVGAVSGAAFGIENVGRGAAAADYDGDGDLDLAIGVNGGDARLLRNEGGSGGSLRVVLRGPSRSSLPGKAPKFRTSTFAVGALVRIATGPLTQVRLTGGSSSYLSQSPPGEAFFGIGSAKRIDRLEVEWPDGVKEAFTDLPARATIFLAEGAPPEVRAAPEAKAAREADPPAPDKAAVLRFWRTFEEATARRMKGDCAAAVPIYKDALAADPRHEDSLYYLGQCLRNLGRYPEARETWTRLAEVNSHSARGHLALGALLASPEEGAPLDLKAAEERFRRAHEINGEETGPMVRLGEVLLVQGRHDEARRWLESAERSNPKSVEAPFLLGYLDWLSGNAAGAEAACRRAAKAGRTDAPIKGVLSEGDRKAAPGPGSVAPTKIAAPPLREPMGRTLFGALASDLNSGAAVPDPLPAGFLDRTYRPVRAFVTRLESRAAAFESARRR